MPEIPVNDLCHWNPRIWRLLLVLTTATPTAPALAAGSENPSCGVDWLKLLGLVGAAVAFFVGLRQYRKAQRWKRVEFLADEIKELLADRKASLALSMIDQTSQKFALASIDDDEDLTLIEVSVKNQWTALLPHTVPNPAGSEIDPDTKRRVRDCYDALLDRLDRLGSCLRTELIAPEDLRPYLAYYIHDIAAPAKDEEEAMWTVAFLVYVYFYHFDGVPALFHGFNRAVEPDGPNFESFVRGVPSRYAQLARDLQGKALAASEETRRALLASTS